MYGGYMLIVLNHKMNFTCIEEIKEYETVLRDYNVIVMPQTPFLGLFTNGKYILGSQCVSDYNATGGVSAEALASLDCRYVMVGHAERRIVRGENDEAFARKVNDLIDNKMIPILCIGETLEEKEAGLKESLIEKQISNIFSRLTVSYDSIHIAYEPVWSIGNDQKPSNKEIEATLAFIKNYLKEKYHTDNKLLYGGSVDADNVESLKKIEILDGIIIGNASLDINEVIKIYNIVNL